MESLPLSSVLFGLAALFVYLALFSAGIRHKLLQEFRIFYFVVGTYCAIDLSNWIARSISGPSSWTYFYNYYGTEIIQVAADAVLLIVIFIRIREGNAWLSWITAAAKTVFLAWLLWSLRSPNLEAFDIRKAATIACYAGFAFWLVVATQVMTTSKPLGRRWGGIFLGLTLIALLRIDHYGMRLLEDLSDSHWKALKQPIEFVPWIIYIRFITFSRPSSAGSQADREGADFRALPWVERWGRRLVKAPPPERRKYPPAEAAPRQLRLRFS